MNNYKILISKNSGFCMGVKNAFKKSIEIGNMNQNTILLGDIVHNRFAIKQIIESGLIVDENIDSIINNKAIKNVIIRAHGVSPEIEKQLRESKKNIYDLTCPIVKKVQLLTKKLSNENHEIIIFGKLNHPEVIGIQGYASSNFIIISNTSDAENINRNLLNPVLISQTTMNSKEFIQISTILKEIFPHLTIYNTLCNNTIKTQEYAIKLSHEVDLMIVIGDKKSSNTISLYNKVKENIETIFVEDIQDIDIALFKNKNRIGLAGGSSTPDYQIEKIKKFIESLETVT
ncbi:MAG: 4-hydroxy-3-methylbut-2-enyl diphosphate reductase [Spirochaetes bacterium GWF1_31_7]|nr:MAG: 4-hydroxy-3-methylbut-2-enyl diphosphate reductase [Spirochaetes bacterium GWE1_32_154]OHD48849.1 MAG: 4-hydroxy-3-methylbut-2-enyl diphosphate reductase [Spirochaetes bacterium GWF1_31_7]OHD78301.1 MAG: 4-hydroxy-3-methylbut-2-enyl diphosphate reductase [Spirochaetes bacterium RIFOXYB1_FULL_32_8]HBD92664.1 4-hydroxy-3-methylbut-2-enyl diphosphate reductase [Spirochaetia bacterium]HBI36884.1 4-hydroxy-3-methylbut-2-enyl diphosphate reductase [Spirochaetia bacterium]